MLSLLPKLPPNLLQMAPHSSTFAWRTPWMEEPGRLQSMGSLRVGHNWATSLSLFHFHALEKEMATHSSVLAWRIPGAGQPSGLMFMGSHRVGHDWSDLAAGKLFLTTVFKLTTLEKKKNHNLPTLLLCVLFFSTELTNRTQVCLCFFCLVTLSPKTPEDQAFLCADDCCIPGAY